MSQSEKTTILICSSMLKVLISFNEVEVELE